MRSFHAVLVLLAPMVVAACNEAAPPAPDITETFFDSSLHIDVSTMIKTSDGLYYVDKIVGSGITAASGDSVYVYYSGYLSNGKKFDGVASPNPPFPFDIGDGGTIQGFAEGVTGMHVGGTRTVIIPPELGYGDQPQSSIPSNSILVFTLQLINVKRN